MNELRGLCLDMKLLGEEKPAGKEKQQQQQPAAIL
jgi:hypothetical protein